MCSLEGYLDLMETKVFYRENASTPPPTLTFNLKRERTGVCKMTVKRTKLCYWITRPAKPGVQSSNTSRVRFTVITHTSVHFRFYHIHILYKRNWDGSWLMYLTQQIYSYLHIFQTRSLFHCVAESWWNMPFKGTRHGNGMADGVIAKLLRLW